MNPPKRPTVVVFCKAPVPGRLKTRLIPAFTPQEAAALGVAMLLDVLGSVVSNEWHTVASVARHEDRGAVAALVPAAVEVCVQPVGSLGERMAQEMHRHGAADRRPVAIVGSDCPEISAGHVHGAFRALRDGADAAICPSGDGGYSLIAAEGRAEPLFREIPWSTDRVTARTRLAANGAGLRLDQVGSLEDVDRAEDVVRLVGRDTDPRPIAARTRAVAVALRNKRPGLAISDGECQTAPL